MPSFYEGDARILMTALLTGTRTEFDDTLYSQLSETGVTHVTAVSGMHCAFLFGMVRLLVKNRRKAALVGIPLLFFFYADGGRGSVGDAGLYYDCLIVCSPAAASGKRQRYNHECSPCC